MPNSEKLLNVYLHSVDVGVVVVDEPGTIRLVNKTFLKFIGKSADTLEGQHFEHILPSSSESRTALENLILGKQDQLGIVRIWWKHPESFIYIKGYASNEVSDHYGSCRILFLRDVSEEVLYRERLDYQAAVLQNVRDSVIVTDEEGKITYWNQAATDLFGHKRREMLHHTIDRLNVAVDMSSFLEEIRQQRDFTSSQEWPYLRPDGKQIWADVKISPLHHHEQITGLICVAKDITDKKQKERDLYRKQKELASLVDSQTNYLIRTDLEGNFTYANPAFVQRFHQFENIIGSFSMETIIPEDHEKTYQMVEDCLSQPGKMVPIEIRKPNPKGGHYINYWEFIAITDEEGNPTEIQGVGYEITEKKKQEEQLQRSQQELTSIVNSQTNYLIRTDLEGYFTYVNPAFQNKFGYRGKIVGTFSMDTIIPEDHEKTYQMVEDCLSQPGKMVPVEIRKPNPDGGYYINHWEFVAITDLEGNPTEIQGVGYDITDRSRYEWRIKNLNELNHLLLNISTNFINISPRDLDKLIPDALRSVTEFTGFERAFVYLFDEGMSSMNLAYHYHVPGIKPFGEEEKIFPTKPFSWWMKQILADDIIQVPVLEDLPAEAQHEREMLEQLGIKSILSIPISSQREALGFLGFTTLNAHKKWNGESMGLLKLLGAIFANSLFKAKQERQLKESNAQYKLLADNITDMVSQHDLQGIFSYVSPSCGSLLGWPLEKMIGSSFTDWVHPQDEAQVKDALKDIGQQGQGRFVARLRQYKGDYIWVETIGTVVGKGNKKELVAVTRNIHQQKSVEHEKDQLLQQTQAINEELNASEEELRQNLEYTQELNERLTISERHFKGLIEKSFDAIVVYDERGFITYASPSASRITGFPEMKGMHGSTFVIEEDLPEAEQIMQQVLQMPGEHISFEQRLRRKDGKIIWIEAVMTNQLDDEAIRGLVSNFRDINDRKRALQALEESRTSLNIAQRVSKVGSWELDLATGEVIWSEEFYHILGLDPEVHSPDNVDAFQMIHPDDQEEVRQRNERVTSELKEIPISYRIINAKGRLKFIDALNRVIRDQNGKAVKMLGTIQDVTQETELANLLEETSRIAKVGGWEFDLFDNKLTWTEETYRIHDYPLDAPLIVEKAIDFYHPEDRPVISEAFRKLVEKGEQFKVELRLITAQGKLKWVRSSGGTPDHKGGIISKVRGTIQDITEEIELESFLEDTSRLAKLGGWEYRVLEDKIIWTAQTYRIHEVDPSEEISFTSGMSLYHPDDQRLLAKAGERLLTQGEKFDLEVRMITGKGELKWIRTSVGSVERNDGKIFRIRGFIQDITDQKNKDEQLRNYSERLMLAVKTARIGIWELDLATNKLSWNDQQLAIYGISREKFEEDIEYWKTLLHSDDREAADAEIAKVLEGESVFGVEFRIIRPDGELRYINASAQPIFNEQGEVVRLIGVNLDISGIKKNEEQIRSYSERLSLAMQTAGMGIWEHDLETNQFSWNDELLEIYGVSHETLAENNALIKKLVHPEDVEEADRQLQRAYQNHEVSNVEFRIIRDDGSLRYISASARPVSDATGKMIKLIGISLDITSIRVSQLAAQDYNRRLTLATEAAEIGVWDLDLKQGKLIWDERTFQQYGVKPEVFGGSFEDWQACVHPDDVEEATRKFNEALEKEQDYDAVFRVVRADTGDTRYIQTHATMIGERNTDHLSMIGVSWDITEQKENEQVLIKRNEDLQKVNKELDHFVYSTSHNLRAPLTSIMGIVQILSEVEAEEERQGFVELIGKSIHKLDETIQEISDYSRNSRVDLQVAPINFHQIIAETKESLSFMEKASQLQYRVEVTEQLDFYSDLSRIKIIFNNLMSNAVKYMNTRSAEPYISVRISKATQGVNMVVEDNGIGIKQEHLSRIFDMFFRATTQATGSGLGLYIVKEAVNRLKGDISISSQQGLGTRFDIYLPDLR
jgi:PAS domain S-box-containing protein